MSDELRDEYAFDYRQARPNRFATAVKATGIVTPSHTDLTDEQRHLLEDLYAATPLSVDDLPYTDDMEQLHRAFVQQSGLTVTIRDVYKALKNLGRQGRLGGKLRGTPAPTAE
ncbi:MAG: hypothetical protein U0736_06515 [Gemmataceae bacterium]